MDQVRISMGRTVQIVDYKDTVRYDVSISYTRDVEGGEAIPTFLHSAKKETAQVFKDVEAVMLQTAGECAAEEVEANASFGTVNEITALDPKFPKPGGTKKAAKRTAPRRRRRPPPK